MDYGFVGKRSLLHFAAAHGNSLSERPGSVYSHEQRGGDRAAVVFESDTSPAASGQTCEGEERKETVAGGYRSRAWQAREPCGFFWSDDCDFRSLWRERDFRLDALCPLYSLATESLTGRPPPRRCGSFSKTSCAPLASS